MTMTDQEYYRIKRLLDSEMASKFFHKIQCKKRGFKTTYYSTLINYDKESFIKKHTEIINKETKELGRVHSANRRAGGSLSVKTIQKVYEYNIKKYGTLTCYLCLKPIPFGKDELEHKTPISRGGKSVYRNLGVACKQCNSDKRIKTEQEFRAESRNA